MAEDTSVQSLFDYAKLAFKSHSGEFPLLETVFATFVEQWANSHPPSPLTASAESDLVCYGNGKLRLSADKTKLSGEFKFWRNIYKPASPGFGTAPATAADVFADNSNTLTIAISVSSAGVATYQKKLNGVAIGNMPPVALAATYNGGMFVEQSAGHLRALSFTLGGSYD